MPIDDSDPWQSGYNAGLSAGLSAASSTAWTPDPHAETTDGGLGYTIAEPVPVGSNAVNLVLDPTADAARARKALRDEFAKAAMNGMYSCRDCMNELCRMQGSKEDARAEISRLAYKQADSMLDKRDKAE